jgi:hypothetical protein
MAAQRSGVKCVACGSKIPAILLRLVKFAGVAA